MPNIAVLQEISDGVAASATTIVKTITGVTAGSSIHVVGSSSGSPPSMSCADNVNGAHTALDALVSDGGAGHRGQHFKFDNSAAGTLIVTVTFGASVTSRHILIREIGNTSGFDVSASENDVDGSIGTDGIATLTATPTVAPGLISAVGIIHSGTGDAISAAGTDFFLDVHPLTNWGFIDSASEHYRYTTTNAHIGSFSVSGSVSPSSFVFAAFFKEVAQQGPAPSILLYHRKYVIYPI